MRLGRTSTPASSVTPSNDPEIRDRLKAKMALAREKAEKRRQKDPMRKSRSRYWHVSVRLSPAPDHMARSGFPPFLPESSGLTWHRQMAPRNHFNMGR